MPKRNGLLWMLVMGASAACPAIVFGQSYPYPGRVVRIVTAGAGTNLDVVSRVVAQTLTENLGRPVIVENRNGIVAVERTANATPDGNTLLVLSSAAWTLPLMQKVSLDPAKVLSPVTLVCTAPLFLFVNASVAANSVRDLIALAKAKAGQLNYGMAGNGTSNHLAAELFKSMAHIDIVRVAYKSAGESTTGLLGNQVQMLFTSVATGKPHVATGKLKVLAVAGSKPSALAPEVPTVAASGIPGYEAESIIAMWVPAGTPRPVAKRVSEETLRVLKNEGVRAKFLSYGTEAIGNMPEEAAAYINADTAKWRKLIKEAGIQGD